MRWKDLLGTSEWSALRKTIFEFYREYLTLAITAEDPRDVLRAQEGIRLLRRLLFAPIQGVNDMEAKKDFLWKVENDVRKEIDEFIEEGLNDAT
jgi:hypothetical protein